MCQSMQSRHLTAVLAAACCSCQTSQANQRIKLLPTGTTDDFLLASEKVKSQAGLRHEVLHAVAAAEGNPGASSCSRFFSKCCCGGCCCAICTRCCCCSYPVELKDLLLHNVHITCSK